MPTIDKRAAGSAEGLEFVNSSGGPLLLLAAAEREGWWGCYGEEGEDGDEPEEGESHYDLACEVEGDVGLIELPSGGAGLVLAGPEPTAVLQVPGGALLIRWCGADSAAALVTTALASPEEVGPWVAFELVWRVPGGGLVLLDSAEDGRASEPMNPPVVFELAEGAYSIHTRWWDGHVTRQDGTVEEVMSHVIRLSKV